LSPPQGGRAGREPDERASAAAALLLAVRRGAPRLACLPEGLAPTTLPEAYAIQHELLRQAGLARGGWKATLFDARNGICAPLAADALYDSPARRSAARLPTQAPPTPPDAALRIEPEIAFRFAHALPPLPAGQSYDRAQVLAAVGSAHAVLELVASRYRHESSVTQLERVADAYMNEGLVVGPACGEWRSLDLLALPLLVEVGGREHLRGTAVHPVGDPVLPLAWIANHLSALGIGIGAGEIVTTGSCAGAPALAPGETAGARFGGLGSVEFRYGD
jgi:2-keto-4-pentenoate hydratase